MVKIWPEVFEKKEHISKEEKELLRNASKIIDDGDLLVNLKSLGFCTDKVDFGMIIEPSKGVVTISIMKDEFDKTKISLYDSLRKRIEDELYGKLLNSKVLIVRNGDKKILKFPYKHVMLFQNYKEDESIDCNVVEIIGKMFSRDFRPIAGLIFTEGAMTPLNYGLFDIFEKQHDSNFTEISKNEHIGILSKLAPEYTIINPELTPVVIEETKDVISEEDTFITGKESEFETFELDDSQVTLVNEMGSGHRVILANPGAGKSVLLMSKAFKYASLYPGENVLLTCFNNNLAESYRFKIATTSFNSKGFKLHALTFHSLVKKIYEEKLNKSIDGDYPSDEEIAALIDYIKEGKVDLKFKAIFIDEVQIFEPMYLDLCYLLLDKSDNSTFTLAGDLNQNVRKKMRKGDAPWKNMHTADLDFKGRVKYIEKNYRNTKQIGEYVDGMLEYMNFRLDKYNLLVEKEFDYESFVNGVSDGPEVILSTGIERINIANEVINKIEELTDKYDCSYSDIAVLFPFREHKSVNYFLEYWLTSELNEKGIPYSAIYKSQFATKQKFTNKNGVTLSTIDSSLGLDFKAVILCGLYPNNYVFTNGGVTAVRSWNDIRKLSEDQKDDFVAAIRKIYTACSRARKILCVLSDLTPSSPIDDVIRIGGDYDK